MTAFIEETRQKKANRKKIEEIRFGIKINCEAVVILKCKMNSQKSPSKSPSKSPAKSPKKGKNGIKFLEITFNNLDGIIYIKVAHFL